VSRGLHLVVWCTVILAGGIRLAAQAKSAAPPPVDVAHFVDIADKAGLKERVTFGGRDSKAYIIETTGTGVAIFDYNNDGWPDIFIVNGTTIGAKTASPSFLYRNNKDGTFTNIASESGINDTGWGQGACVGDYDNDGNEDLFVTYYGKNRLYHNLGNGKFEEVAEKAGVVGDGKSWGTGCAFVDYDRDGKLDIAMATYVDFDIATAPVAGKTANCMWKGAAVMCGPRGFKPSKNSLFHNLGNGRFEDVSAKSGITETQGHYCFSVSPFDYDDDGWPDIYIACDSTPSILYHNQKDGTFKDVGLIAGAAYNEDGREQAGMGVAIGDYDGDGRLDILRTNFSDDTSTLYRNNGRGGFADSTFSAGMGLNTRYLGWGVEWFDFDNDGWPDALLANGHVYPEVDTYKLGSNYREPKVLYRNNGNGTLTDVSRVGGPAITVATSARGLGVGDLWNDGRMSAVISNMDGLPNLLVNETKYSNHWVAFETVGTKSNRSGIGAKITVKTAKRTMVAEVRSGASYDSNSDMRPHFGLGAESAIEYVEVRWPSGLTEKFKGFAVDKIHTLREGGGEAVATSSSSAR
jgi:hypothetical protein